MEAASSAREQRGGKDRRGLAGDKAQRIVHAMRASVARRGAAGSTFDHVAREAGVSRGLLHYYFGTKEKLLVEVVRRDTEIRMAMLDAALADAHTADDFIDALVRSLEDMVQNDPAFVTLWFELFTVARRNEEIGAEVADMTRRTRAHVVEVLEVKQREGVIHLHDEPEAVVTALFALGDGMAMRMLIEPERDFATSMRAGVLCARALLVDHV